MTVYYPMTNLSVENAVVSAKTLLRNTGSTICLKAVYLTMPSYKLEILKSNGFELINLTWLLKDLNLSDIKTVKYMPLFLPYLTDFSDEVLVVSPHTIFYEDVNKIFEASFDFIAAAPAINFLQSSSSLHSYFADSYQLFSSHLLAVKSMNKAESDYFLFKSDIDTDYDSLTVLAWLNAMYFNRWTELDFSWNVKTVDAIFTNSLMTASDSQLKSIELAKQNPSCISYYRLNPETDQLSFETSQKYKEVLKSVN